MIDFSPLQKKTVAAGLTILSLAVVFAFVAFLSWCLLKVLSFASAALVPVMFGFFLALFFRPYYRWWRKVLRNPLLALLVMLCTVFIPLGFLLWHAGSILVDQAANLIAQGPSLVKSVLAWFRETFPRLDALIVQMGGQYTEDVTGMFAKYGSTALKAGTGALKLALGTFSVLVSLVFFVFFLMTKDRRSSDIVALMPFFKDDTRQFLAAQVDAFTDILVSFYQRQTVICLMEGLMYGAGFWAVGLPYGFLIGFMLGVLNLIPFLGSVVCLPVALPLAYFAAGGSCGRLVAVLLVWVAGQILDGYLITPKIQGGKTGLGYAGAIFSFIFWGTVLGPLMGMLLAIPLSAFCVVLWQAVRARYIRPVV